LDLLHEKGPSNLSQVVQQKLYSKLNSDQLQNCSPPLQDSLYKHGVNEVMLNVVHHTPQQLEEVFLCRTTKEEALHEVSATTIGCLQMGDTLFKYPEVMKHGLWALWGLL